MRYPGGKGGAGVYQTIINMMPAHHTYIETHFGGGNIFERKRPAQQNIVIDIDPAVTSKIAMPAAAGSIAKNSDGIPSPDMAIEDLPSITVINGDAGQFLRDYEFDGGELIYSDPPYLMETRKCGPLYRYEYSDEQHEELLSLLLTMRARGVNVMLSGYRSSLYEARLQGWHSVDFKAMTRGGPAIETVWMNFIPGDQRHDLQYLGNNFRERERIKRQQRRWRARLEKMPALERQAMLEILTELAMRDIASLN
jgi:DNA adenine methylase